MAGETDDPKARTRTDPAATTLTVQGVAVPKLGFGTWLLEGDDCERGVRVALDEAGYRHVDTAKAYGNEDRVGRAMQASAVPREEVFLTTKVWTDAFGHDDLIASAEQSLRDLRTDHVDLLLLHWPNPDVPLGEPLGALAELREQGKIANLGLSNFPSRLVAEALEHAPVFCNQVEYHAYLGQPRLLHQAREHDLLLTAYSPFAHGRLLDDPVLREVAEAHGRTTGQVALRWLLDQPQVATIPKATSPERIRENAQVFDFALTDEERNRIARLERGERTADPSFAPDWD
jgi:2,5-diketo-D-gluconate reductase B